MQQLADLIPPASKLGERTLRKLEYGESVLTPPILRELAVALGVSYEWFTVPDLRTALGTRDAATEARLLEMERRLTVVLERLDGMSPSPPSGAPRRRGGDASVPRTRGGKPGQDRA